jgi:type VI secretion system protein ImpM
VSTLGVFAFGKLPSHGDFIARGLSAPERQAWDDWASAGLTLAREALGEAFEPAHTQAPPWRFAFGDGAFGPARKAGAFASSIDRAGRRFLIVLGVAAPVGLDPDGAGAVAAQILETEIYQAFQTGADADALVQSATAALAGFAPGAAAPGGGRFWTADAEEAVAAELRADVPPAELLLRALTTAEPGHG